MKKPLAQQALTICLYLLPAIFITSLFLLIIVSSEDIDHGAGTGGSLWAGAQYGFRLHARWPEIYDWAINRIYDYQFSFGIDTIFRLLDATMAIGIIYLATALVLGRKLQNKLQDATIFSAIFIAIFLSSFCISYMLSLAHIHNYLIISICTLLFLYPYAKKIQGKPPPSKRWFKVSMLIMGFLFGFSCNITPIAFIITQHILWRKAAGSKLEQKKLLRSWEFMGLLGITIACFVMYGLGPGLSQYIASDNYNQTNYVAFSDILSVPLESGLTMLSHAATNLIIMAPCLLSIGLVLLFEIMARQKKLIPDSNQTGIKFSSAGLIFVIVHILIMSQINAKEVTRLLIPAYLVTIIVVGFSVTRIIRLIKVPARAILVTGSLVASLAIMMTIDLLIVKVNYYQHAKTILQEIRDQDASSVCLPEGGTWTPRSRLFGFTQHAMLETWMTERTDEHGAKVYGKTLRDCSEKALPSKVSSYSKVEPHDYSETCTIKFSTSGKIPC